MRNPHDVDPEVLAARWALEAVQEGYARMPAMPELHEKLMRLAYNILTEDTGMPVDWGTAGEHWGWAGPPPTGVAISAMRALADEMREAAAWAEGIKARVLEYERVLLQAAKLKPVCSTSGCETGATVMYFDPSCTYSGTPDDPEPDGVVGWLQDCEEHRPRCSHADCDSPAEKLVCDKHDHILGWPCTIHPLAEEGGNIQQYRCYPMRRIQDTAVGRTEALKLRKDDPDAPF